MKKTLGQLREELGLVSQGHVQTTNAVLIHLAFRLSQEDAESFIRQAVAEGVSESLLARKAILQYLAPGIGGAT